MKKFRIDQLNPIIIIIILLFVSIIISFDRKPFFALALFVLVMLVQVIWSDYSLWDLIKQLRFAFLLAFVYVFFIWLTRMLSNLAIDYLYLLSLMGRFLVFASYTFLLVNNVTTKSLTMALIKYFKLPYRVGFAFMAVYNFIPSYQRELNQIKYTYSIRGLNKKGLFSGFRNMAQYSIPLLVSSIRKGIRLSVSMENRGLGKYETRSYYQEMTLKGQDWIFLGVYLLLILVFIVVGWQTSLILM